MNRAHLDELTYSLHPVLRPFEAPAAQEKPGPKGTAHLKPTHGEEQVGVVLGVHGDEGVVPVQSGERARQPVLHVPERGAAQVDIMLHEAHARIARPALLVVVAHDVLIVGVWVLCQEALDQVLRLLRAESEQDVDLRDHMCKQSNSERFTFVELVGCNTIPFPVILYVKGKE